ncbi:putative transcription factor bHLH family [Medicago truncatula]|uniref:Putative transcription factor bHLH family n=2 Tax=Medicago truncatula TaxID=3880 RepID=A0A072TQD6_MEDTR|nr:transcription factor bHLH130 isoform X1 [Medicago truncatula]XP_024629575.1 transcription factor bHLH130 isoform X1 [Medicago truncatula]KEH19058.1 transcription factor bHLH122-like protein [Medicago truncatula]RHN40173.1 putative transcription factor bHLH family [Medicago truncatula]
MSIVYTQAFNYSEGGSMKNTEMDSKFGYSQTQQHCLQNNSGLTRYRSAPSSLLTSLVDRSIGFFNEETFRNENHQQQHYSTSTSSEMETMFTNSESFSVKQEEKDPFSHGIQYNDYSYGSQNQINYQTQHNQGFPNGSLGVEDNVFDGSSNNCSNLIRQKSSPAEFFSNYSVDSGLGCANGQATTSTSGLHGTLNFSSRTSSCSIKMPLIVENEHEVLQANCIKSRNMGNDNCITKSYMPSFTNDYWDSSTFSAPKNASNKGEFMFSTSNALETQNVDFGYQKLGLTHHLSLPSSSSKMATMEKFLHLQGSVPCKIRAKRGFATHPRSIAERERRIRISARIKKLQDLFPNADKQNSTADMLDEAVEYIKDLRKQLKILTETKAKCSCTSN